ncbi:hypothetical protein A5821_002171 [Enterococcus sp. 7F3_DIV0205]|uniref:Lactococcin 972 family bacteriocin n=1 Tax=Candidatus Enterococcus palustris TaxID=1834189 RepID=A0AAQ3Y7S3_9ENTE|nr:lactococcin 972 family bacteriocin [Enterococcus sp. 7F3_DIV0205]OTN82610.1 hypothetical protein A5821_002521 [Enterococcus sp. 7F3_DIV0205]
MKKIVLMVALLGLFYVTIEKVGFADEEPTSGGLNAEQLEQRGSNIQSRMVKSVGGGTWYYMTSVNGKTISEYYHRDKKHSATVSRSGGVYNKSVQRAGQWAKAALTYKSGVNSVYWDNAPKEGVGTWTAGKF